MLGSVQPYHHLLRPAYYYAVKYALPGGGRLQSQTLEHACITMRLGAKSEDQGDAMGCRFEGHQSILGDLFVAVSRSSPMAKREEYL